MGRRNPLPEFSKSLRGSEKKDEDKEEAKSASDSKVEYKRALFGQLTKRQVLALYKNYKIDFDIFGHNVTEFLEYAQYSSYKENDMDGSEEEDNDEEKEDEEEEDEDGEDEDEEDEEKEDEDEEEEDEDGEDEEEDGDDDEDDE